jgi:hypothetical protein
VIGRGRIVPFGSKEKPYRAFGSKEKRDRVFLISDKRDAFGDWERRDRAWEKVEGELIGINKRNLSVITIWLNRKIDGKCQFITLKPKKEKSTNV